MDSEQRVGEGLSGLFLWTIFAEVLQMDGMLWLGTDIGAKNIAYGNPKTEKT